MKKKLRRFILTALAACVFLTGIIGCGGNKETNNVVPEFNGNKQFRIFADCPPKPTREYLEDYKAAGFNMHNMTEDDYAFTGENGEITEEYANAISLCEEMGLDVIIRNHHEDVQYFVNDDDSERVYETVFGPLIYSIPIRNITTELVQMPAVKGFYMLDEPSYDFINTVQPLIDWYNAYGGNTFFHINLNSSYGNVLFPQNTWEEYLDHYINTILKKVNGPKSLSIDYYPLKTTSTDRNYVEEEYLYNYFVIAGLTKEMNDEITNANDKVQTGFCIQAYKEPNVRWLTSSRDISFQTNMAAAFGAKTFEYYLYRGLSEDDGMVGRTSHKLNPLYYYVQTANQEMAGVADAILSFDWVGARVFEGNQIKDEYNQRAFELVKNLELEKFRMIKEADCRLDTVISEFEDGENNVSYMVLNYSEPSLGQTDFVNITFSENISKAVVYIKGERSVVDVKENMLTLEIGAGDAAFVYPVR